MHAVLRETAAPSVPNFGLPGRQKLPSQQRFCRVQNSVRLICAENPLGFDHVAINRVSPCSTTHQETAAQTDELRGAGCVEVFAEKVSSRAPLEKRHQLRACLETVQKGDELVVSKLGRLGRSHVEVINRLADLQEKGIHIRTLDGLFNTRGLGRLAPLVIGLLTGLAEVERSLIQERTRESVEHRRKTGGNLGGNQRPPRRKNVLCCV